ncbi:hypothetical protein IH574_03395 [Candidatus Bathyarchaeota archaeon]|nr:hypothetical protein [Candidatus Bathyarchaeota archaeon]
MSRSRKIRGYPVAVLIGLEERRASVWNIYSQSIKPDTVIKQESSSYNFYETLVDLLRPNIKQGVKTVLIASPDDKNWKRFYEHIEKHQRWLIGGYELNRVTLEYVEGSAENIEAVMKLIEKSGLQRTIEQASREDSKRVMGVLEKRLGSPEGIDSLLFSLDELEAAVYGEASRIEYVLLSTDFHQQHRRRTQRLLQVAQNKGIKAMTVEANTPMGTRVSQFGGLICMMNGF